LAAVAQDHSLVLIQADLVEYLAIVVGRDLNNGSRCNHLVALGSDAELRKYGGTDGIQLERILFGVPVEPDMQPPSIMRERLNRSICLSPRGSWQTC
jgi:hypothetical protein